MNANTGQQPLRLVGILGGMGPAATVDLMHKIVNLSPARRDQSHIPLVVWNVPQIPPRTPAITSTTEPSPVPAMLRGAYALRDAHVEAIAIACNTAHHWALEIEAAAGAPLIHIADVALDALAMAGGLGKRTILLATEGTHQAGFYAARAQQRGIALDSVPHSLQLHVSQAIEHAKSGDIALAQSILFPVLQGCVDQGIQHFILACTELPLLVSGSVFERYSVDATHALARSIIAFSMGAPVGSSAWGHHLGN
jgi:aspartate racemase